MLNYFRRAQARAALLLALVALAVSPLGLLAQDAPPPESTADPSIVVTTETPTETPVTSSPEPPTAAPEASETPLPPTETVPPELTETTAPPPEMVTPPTEIPPVTVLPPEPLMQLLVRDLFDSGDLSAWLVGPGWSLVASETGLALQVASSSAPLQLARGDFFNVAAQARFLLQAGSAQLSLRQSSVGSYLVSLDASGMVILYRAGVPVQMALVAPSAPGQWRILRLSAIGDVVRVAVDNVEVMAWQDSATLPPGLVTIAGAFILPADGTALPENTLLVDEFFLWVPESEAPLYLTPTPPPTEVPVVTDTPTETEAVPTETPTEVVTEAPTETPTDVPPTEPPVQAEGKDLSPAPPPSPAQLLVAQAAPNDNFSAATAIGAVPFATNGDTTAATLESNETVPTCGFGLANTVWFSFNPAVTANYTLSTAGSGFDTILAVYTGSAVNTLTQVGCNDDASTATFTSLLTLNLTSGMTYRIQIGGFNGRWGLYTFSLQQAGLPVPPAPALDKPANGITTNDNTPTLSWIAAASAHTYEIQVDNASTFSLPLIYTKDSIPSGTLADATDPLADGTYYWRVRAKNINGAAGPWSAVRSIIIRTTPPVLNSPASGVTLNNSRPTFTWQAFAGAKQYTIEFDSNGDNNPDSNFNPTPANATTFTPPNALAQGNWQWRVRVSQDALDNINGVFSNWRAFTINILNSPAQNAVISSTTPTFTWTAVPGATGYQLEISASDTFGTLIQPTSGAIPEVTGTSYTLPTPLDNGNGGYGIFYWRVKVRLSGLLVPAAPPFRKLTISPTAPPAPVLKSPNNGVTTSDTTPRLCWDIVTSGTGATIGRYEVQIARNSTFTNMAQSGDVVPSGNPQDCYDVNPALAPDGTYYWRVRAVNSLEVAGSYSGGRNFILRTTPPVQTAPPITPITNTKPTFTWQAFAGATQYTIEFDANMDDVADAAFNPTVPSFVPPVSLPQGTARWRVRATDALGNNGVFSVWRAFTIDIRTGPTNGKLFTTATTTNVTFTWAAVQGATGYKLYLYDDDTCTTLRSGFPMPVNATSSAVAGLAHGKYCWKLEVVSIDPGIPPLPGWQFTVSPAAPPALTLTGPASGVTTNDTTPMLTWNGIVATGAAAIAKYQVQMATNAAFTVNLQTIDVTPVAGIPQSYTVNPALTDGTYYWRVRAVNSLNVMGNYSAARNFIIRTTAPVQTAPPTTPITNAKPTFTWQAFPGAKEYEIQFDSDDPDSLPDAGWPVTVTTTSYTPPPSFKQGVWQWQVRVSKDALDSTSGVFSVWRAFTIDIRTGPTNGKLFTTTTTANVTFTWAAVQGAMGYNLYLYDDDTCTTLRSGFPMLVNATSSAVAGLAHGKYCWKVQVVGVDPGIPPLSGRLFTVSPAAPPAPVLVSPPNGAIIYASPSELKWNKVTSGAGATIAKYEVQVATNSTFTNIVQAADVMPSGSAQDSYPVNPVLGNGTYFWRVRAKNSLDVYSAWSAYRSFTIVTPAAPTLLAPPNDSSTTTNPPQFKWGTVPGGKTYNLMLGDTCPPTTPINGLPTTTYTPSAPLLLKTYCWKVQAVDALGNAGPWSVIRSVKIVSLTTAAPLPNRYAPGNPAPMNLPPTLTWGPISWTSPSGHYEVQVDNNANFSSPEFQFLNIPTGTQSVVVTPTPANGTWYWRVRACSNVAAATCGAWSSTGAFTVES